MNEILVMLLLVVMISLSGALEMSKKSVLWRNDGLGIVVNDEHHEGKALTDVSATKDRGGIWQWAKNMLFQGTDKGDANIVFF